MSYFTTTLHAATAEALASPWIDVRNFDGVAIHFLSTGSPVGTLSFQASLSADKSNPVAVTLYTAGSPATPVTSTTAAGIFTLPGNHAYYWLRAVVSAYTSGAFSVLAGRRSTRNQPQPND